MKSYEKMRKQEAAAALQEFLDERPHALEHLTRYLTEYADGTVHLDETVESLTPLWRWVKSVLTELTVESPEPEASTSPTWLRYGIGTEPILSPKSIEIIDGVISYLCRVVEQGAPKPGGGLDTTASSRTCGRTTRCWHSITWKYHSLPLFQALPEDKPAGSAHQMTTSSLAQLRR
ncbi:hypothetical protein M1D93_13525 [Arthrobacter sp. Z1-9]